MTAKSEGDVKSDALEAIYSAASGLRMVGAIDKMTMFEYEEMCRSGLPRGTEADEDLVRNQNDGADAV